MMVAMTTTKRRLHPCLQFLRSKIKTETMIIVTMGIVILCVLSLEPAIGVMQLHGRISNDHGLLVVPTPRRMMLATTSLPPLRQYDSTTSRYDMAPSRYGMAPKETLRSSIMYPIDILELDKPTTRTTTKRKSTVTAMYHSDSDSDTHQPVQEKRPLKPRLDRVPHKIVVTHPRMVRLDDLEGMKWSPTDDELQISIHNQKPVRFEAMSYSNSKTKSQQQQQQQQELEVLPFERPFYEECEPIRQPKVHPTCNSMHELTMDDQQITLLSTKGSWRIAWTVQNDTAVLKVLQWAREFDKEAFDHHALDVIVSDLLTASPYVIDAYAFCGQSILQEWAPSGGRDFVKSYDIRNRQRLRIARDLARGLADLQALQAIPHGSFKDSDGLISFQVPPPPPLVFAHNDINIANTIYADGRVKWNDFNIGILLRTKIGDSNTECGAPVRFRADLWRSPEEVRNSTYVKPQFTDIYGFGNILYQVMTRHQPWTHKEPEGQLTVQQVADRKLQGRLPTFPEQYRNTTNKDLQTLVLATMSCYHPNPSKRPTAYELAHALSYVYDRLQNKQKVPSDMLRQLFLRKGTLS